MRKSFAQQVEELEQDWAENPRWAGIQRDYSAEEASTRWTTSTPSGP